MILWIDCAQLSEQRVFGMSVPERHLKAIAHARLPITEAILDLGNSSLEPKLDGRKYPFPVRIVRHGGSLKERIAAEGVTGEVMLLPGDVLADARLYPYLAQTAGDVAAEIDGAIIAKVVHLESLASDAAKIAEACGSSVRRIDQSEFPAFIRKLRRSTPFYLFRIGSDTERRKVERFLFWSNYKGSTDFFTKYIYPPLVWVTVRPLARAKVHPNVVTLVSIALTFAAVPLFASGYFLAGFLCAYGMSVLDSVDGKLARLTFTDSPIGNVLDHGLDLVHPPFWYCAWAWGLSEGDLGSPVFIASLWMLGLYVLDRLILKIYPTRFGRGLHTHAPLDGFVRTFISRRNINLPLFTVGYVIGLGSETIYLIVFWQALTCLYHGIRTAWILAYDQPQASAEAGAGNLATKR